MSYLDTKAKVIPKAANKYFQDPEQVEEEAKIDHIEFYKAVTWRVVLYWILVLCTAGFLLLLSKWRPYLHVFFKYVATTPSQAEYLLVYGIDDTFTHTRVRMRDFYSGGVLRKLKSFKYRLYFFYFEEQEQIYKPIEFTIKDKTYEQVYKEMGQGISSDKAHNELITTYGENSTDVPVRGSIEILIDEILSPFYLFQLFAVIFWGFFNHYEKYAGTIFGISVITLAFGFFNIKLNEKLLRDRAFYEIDVRVFRSYFTNGEEKTGRIINSKYLVPGDLFEIPEGKKLPCDAILYQGSSVMNESMLTGECVPIIKQPLPPVNKPFNAYAADQYVLFSGTECLETRRSESTKPVIGIVLRTGFSTSKGRLVRAFMYSKPEKFRFYADSIKFIAAMALIAIICFCISIKSFIEQGQETEYIVLKSLDIITIAVPPALPTCVAIGSALARARLAKKKILTRSEIKINVAGKVNFMCFDKTGTLTKDSLDLNSIRVNTSTGFNHALTSNIHEGLNNHNESTSHRMLQLMSCCHAITYVKGKINGDPLELKMLEAVNWKLDETRDLSKNKVAAMIPPAGNGYFKSEVTIVQRFEFNAALQRMSVIAKDPSEEKQRILVKGSPEMIKTLCKPESLPADFAQVLFNYTQDGLRVIACASRILETDVSASDNLERETFESNLEFIGFIIFENKMKPETPGIITKLKAADVHTIMLTGDNPLTAIFVAKDCGILDKNQKVVIGTLNKEGDKKFVTWNYSAESAKSQQPTQSPVLSQPAQEDVAILVQATSRRPEEDILEIAAKDRDISIVLTGDAFNFLATTFDSNSAVNRLIVSKAKVFARMKPDDKAMVVTRLQALGHMVGMCGDGANDCPALKVANVGLALSDAEASLAAPFMSKVLNISSVDILLREGRTALVTSFQCFKYMAMYSLIQTFSTIILYTRDSSFPDYAFLYQDIFIIFALAFTMSLTQPTKKLSKETPTGALLSFPVLLAVLGQCAIQAIAQIVALNILIARPWYKTPDELTEELIIETGDPDAIDTDWDGTILFSVGSMQYFATVLAFSFGKPFRKPFYRNYLFTICLLITWITTIVIILVPMPGLYETFELRDFDEHPGFKWIIILICAVNTVITIAWERTIVPFVVKHYEVFMAKRRGIKKD